MNNPILQSEGFERAAGRLAGTAEDLTRVSGWFGEHVQTLSNAVNTFNEAVARLARIEGMKAENAQRQHRGEAMAYGEGDFANA